MNIHIVYLPVLQSYASQVRKCAPRKAKRLTNNIKINYACFRRHPGKALTRGRRHLWSEAWGVRPPSQKHQGGLRTVSISQIWWPQGDWSLLDHIWPWALGQTPIFSKNNTQRKYKLNNSRAMVVFLCFQRIKVRIMLAVLNWNKSLK